jgi:putative transposase
MSQTLSPSLARCYGMARVARVWKFSRASIYRSRKGMPPNTSGRRPGPGGACSDAELAEHIGIPYRRVRFQTEDRARPAGRAEQRADFDLGPRARRLLI